MLTVHIRQPFFYAWLSRSKNIFVNILPFLAKSVLKAESCHCAEGLLVCRARDWSARITTWGISHFSWPDNIWPASQKYSFSKVNPVQVWSVELWQFLQNKGLARTEGLNPRKQRKAKLVHRGTPFPATLLLSSLWITSPMPRRCSKHSQIMGLPSPLGPAAYSAFLWNSSVHWELTISPTLERVPLLSSPLPLISSFAG